MDRLPNLNSRRIIQALKQAGFIEDRQRGSHLLLRHPTEDLKTIVPIHPGDVKRSTLKQILKQAGLSEKAFRNFL